MPDNFQNRAGGQSKEKHPIWRWIWLREGFQKKRKKSGRRVVKNQPPILKKDFFSEHVRKIILRHPKHVLHLVPSPDAIAKAFNILH